MPPRTKQTSGAATCPQGQVVNPQTGKCIKIDGPTYKKVFGSQAHPPAAVPAPRPDRGNPGTNYPVQGPCPPGKVVNPLTKKCIKRGGPSYNKIFGKPGNSQAAAPQVPHHPDNPCPAGKVLNPRTKKCITVGGKAWKDVFGASAQQQPPPTQSTEPTPITATETTPIPSPVRAPVTINAERRMFMNTKGWPFDKADAAAKRRIDQVGISYKQHIAKIRFSNASKVLRLCILSKAVERKRRFQITHVFLDKVQAEKWMQANRRQGQFEVEEIDVLAPLAMSRDMNVHILYYADKNVGSYEHEHIVAIAFDRAVVEDMKSKIATHVAVMEMPVQIYP